MEKSQAIEKLKRQATIINDLKRKERYSPEFGKWLRDTEVAIERIFGSGTRHLGDFRDISYSLGVCTDRTPESDFQEAFVEGLDNANMVLQSFIEEIEEYGSSPQPEKTPNYLAKVERLIKRFNLVVRQLRDRYNNRQTLSVEDEYDVQDLLHALLLIDFDDIRPEEWTPSYAGSSSRMDFLLKNEQIVIETKKTRKGLDAKEIGEQLIIDIEKYRGHPDCKTLVCFVYDPEARIGNPKGIENDLNRIEGDLTVKVIIAPTGL